MSNAFDFATPREALREMQAAGAIFSVRRRDDALALSFTYSVSAGGDAELCRAILAAVKNRPPVFFQAFRAAVHSDAVGEGALSPSRSISKEGAETPTEDIVSTTPSNSATATDRGAL